MLTVSDIIHLIQYYYKNANYETAAAEVETVRLEDLRRECVFSKSRIVSCQQVYPCLCFVP